VVPPLRGQRSCSSGDCSGDGVLIIAVARTGGCNRVRCMRASNEVLEGGGRDAGYCGKRCLRADVT
jgi:hypothetical protein